MPYFISKSKNIDAENQFRAKTGKSGYIPVICQIENKKAYIYADAHAIEDDHLDIRVSLQDNPKTISEVVEKVYERFKSQGISEYAKGYYSDFRVSAENAEELAIILSGELDALVVRLRKQIGK